MYVCACVYKKIFLDDRGPSSLGSPGLQPICKSGLGYMVKDHSDSKRKNPQPPLHGLLFPISNE